MVWKFLSEYCRPRGHVPWTIACLLACYCLSVSMTALYYRWSSRRGWLRTWLQFKIWGADFVTNGTEGTAGCRICSGMSVYISVFCRCSEDIVKLAWRLLKVFFQISQSVASASRLDDEMSHFVKQVLVWCLKRLWLLSPIDQWKVLHTVFCDVNELFLRK